MPRRRPLPELLVLGLICAGFAGSILTYAWLFPDNFAFLTEDEVVLGFSISVATFWLAVKLAASENWRSPWLQFVDEFRIATGVNLIMQALLNYLNLLTRSLFLLVVGSLLAATLLALARRLSPVSGKGRAGTLIVGFDGSAEELAPKMAAPLLGVVGGPSVGGAPSTDYADLKRTLETTHPEQVAVTPQAAARIDLPALLKERLHGARVRLTPELYEEMLERVYCRGREPADLVLSQSLSGNAQAMALQAIYTNLIGLFLLILLSPLMAATALAILAFSGPGPVMESAMYSGFRDIPFRRLRFRTQTTDGTGSRTRLGQIIRRLRLTNLPLLINIVRGEMALFGPLPVRREFVTRLTELMPFYSMRLAVKPGMVSWGALQPGRPRPGDAIMDLEYDLYYVKHGSPRLDFEMLLRVLVGGTRAKDSHAEFAAAAR